jgi:hypothetical protein
VPQPGKKTAYLIREAFHWEYGDQPVAVKLLAVWAAPDLEQARAYRDRLVRTCRHLNPFWDTGKNSLDDLTSIGRSQFVKKVCALGLKGPKPNELGWWWSETIATATEDQVAGLWAVLDKVSLYEIEELDAESEPREEKECKRPELSARKAFVVQRLCWQYNDNWHDVGNDEPVKAFIDPDAAELYRLELEGSERARHTANPYRFAGNLAQSSSLTETELVARLTELGIRPPPITTQTTPPSLDFWDDAWWQNLERMASPFQIESVWQLFDRVRFFEVVEIELDR